MKRTVTYRRVGAGIVPPANEREREVDDFQPFIDVADWQRLWPGERLEVRVSYYEPPVETPGMKLHGAMVKLVGPGDLDPWEKDVVRGAGEVGGGRRVTVLTVKEREVMEHATAWRHKNRLYRNHFTTGPETVGWPIIQGLCAHGFMRCVRSPEPQLGGMSVFVVTEAGLALLRATPAGTKPTVGGG